MPGVQDQAGITDGQLGFALLFVGAGALPAMLLVGKALDRWGLEVAALVISALGVVGVGLALTAVDLASLCAGLALAGASSGAADVAMNAVAALSIIAGAAMLKTLSPGLAVQGHNAIAAADSSPAARSKIVPLLLIGMLGALAFASENAHQSWSAVFAHDELHAGAGLTTVAPAVFAGTVAITRFSIGGLKAAHPGTVLLAGALAAAAGAAIIAAAPTLFIAALGLVVAGAGTSVLFPTLLGVVSQNVEESRRGRATSVVTTVSYLGFLLGPVYVGLWADAAGLRGAMVAVAALAAVLFLLAPALLHLSGYGRPR